MKNSKIKVILLVAGEGKRLRPYTLDKPKCMVKIDGISLIDRQLSVLRSEGIDDIVMIGGYKSEALKIEGIRLKLNSKYYETNMVWTLFCAEDEMEREVIVSYGDIVYSREVLRELLQSTSDISITIDKEWESYWRMRNEDFLNDAETLKLLKNGNISEIGKKPRSLDEIEGQYMGLMKFSVRGIKHIKEIFHNALDSGELLGKSVKNAYMTDLLQAVINSGKMVKAVPVYGDWIEVDTVDDLELSISLERVRHINYNL